MVSVTPVVKVCDVKQLKQTIQFREDYSSNLRTMYRTDEQVDSMSPVHQERGWYRYCRTANVLTCMLIHIAYEEYCRLGYGVL